MRDSYQGWRIRISCEQPVPVPVLFHLPVSGTAMLRGCNSTEVSCCNSLAHKDGSRTATVQASEDQFLLFGRWVCIGVLDTLAPGAVPSSQAIPVALAMHPPYRKPHRLKGEILQ